VSGDRVSHDEEIEGEPPYPSRYRRISTTITAERPFLASGGGKP
jgi:hypothetical protein